LDPYHVLRTRIRIREAQKHTVPTDPDPQHCSKEYSGYGLFVLLEAPRIMMFIYVSPVYFLSTSCFLPALLPGFFFRKTKKILPIHFFNACKSGTMNLR
jgi:hypothetical protein